MLVVFKIIRITTMYVFVPLPWIVANGIIIRSLIIFYVLSSIIYCVYNFQVYGMLMARSTYEGMAMGNADKRPFVLTRAGFIGSQRYAATWTGDNLSNWEHLHMSLPMVLQLVSEMFILILKIVPI